MPNPAWLPIVGQGFGDVANQQQFWANFNARQDEGNSNRLNAAQIGRNRWNWEVASEAQRAEDLDAAARQQAAAQARQDRWNTFTAAEQVRQFNAQLDARKDEFRWKKEADQAERDQQLKTVEDAAQMFSPELERVGSEFDKAAEDYAKQLEGYRTAVSRIPVPEGAKRVGDYFAPVRPFVDEATKATIGKANEEVAALASTFAAAQFTYKTAAEAFKATSGTLQQQFGLHPVKVGGKWVIYSGLHRKTFGARTPSGLAGAPPPAAAVADAETETGGARWNPFGSPPATMTGTGGAIMAFTPETPIAGQLTPGPSMPQVIPSPAAVVAPRAVSPAAAPVVAPAQPAMRWGIGPGFGGNQTVPPRPEPAVAPPAALPAMIPPATLTPPEGSRWTLNPPVPVVAPPVQPVTVPRPVVQPPPAESPAVRAGDLVPKEIETRAKMGRRKSDVEDKTFMFTRDGNPDWFVEVPKSPKKGATVVSNYRMYVFDGDRWNPIEPMAPVSRRRIESAGGVALRSRNSEPTGDYTPAGRWPGMVGNPPAPVAFTGEYPVAPVRPQDREALKIYWTPVGPMQWNGAVWLNPT